MSWLGGLFVPALGLTVGLGIVLAGDLLWLLGRGGAGLPAFMLVGPLADISMPLVLLEVFDCVGLLLSCVLQLPS